MCALVAPLERLHPRDCAEIYTLGIKENGIYTIQPDLNGPALEVFQIHRTETDISPAPQAHTTLVSFFWRCACYLWISKIWAL